jgi:hypothetical protein
MTRRVLRVSPRHLQLLDSTPVPCGQSRQPGAGRSWPVTPLAVFLHARPTTRPNIRGSVRARGYRGRRLASVCADGRSLCSELDEATNLRRGTGVGHRHQARRVPVREGIDRVVAVLRAVDDLGPMEFAQVPRGHSD